MLCKKVEKIINDKKKNEVKTISTPKKQKIKHKRPKTIDDSSNDLRKIKGSLGL
jgi:hypothetical protein